MPRAWRILLLPLYPIYLCRYHRCRSLLQQEVRLGQKGYKSRADSFASHSTVLRWQLTRVCNCFASRKARITSANAGTGKIERSLNVFNSWKTARETRSWFPHKSRACNAPSSDYFPVCRVSIFTEIASTSRQWEGSFQFDIHILMLLDSSLLLSFSGAFLFFTYICCFKLQRKTLKNCHYDEFTRIVGCVKTKKKKRRFLLRLLERELYMLHTGVVRIVIRKFACVQLATVVQNEVFFVRVLRSESRASTYSRIIAIYTARRITDSILPRLIPVCGLRGFDMCSESDIL